MHFSQFTGNKVNIRVSADTIPLHDEALRTTVSQPDTVTQSEGEIAERQLPNYFHICPRRGCFECRPKFGLQPAESPDNYTRVWLCENSAVLAFGVMYGRWVRGVLRCWVRVDLKVFGVFIVKFALFREEEIYFVNLMLCGLFFFL